MSSFIDVKYINLCSSLLDRFKQKQTNLWNFRCPLCGDSKKHKNKCRGFIYEKRNKYFYRCHNCSVGTNFSRFLAQISPALHKDYLTEHYGNLPLSITLAPAIRFAREGFAVTPRYQRYMGFRKQALNAEAKAIFLDSEDISTAYQR